MCSTSIKSGQKLSVYNNGYPAIRPVTGTHHCECKISSPSPIIYITLFDYRLNCTGNRQNLTIENEDGIVLAPVCDTFRNGQYNSSNQNLTMVWRGQEKKIGLFWVGFQGTFHHVMIVGHMIKDLNHYDLLQYYAMKVFFCK